MDIKVKINGNDIEGDAAAIALIINALGESGQRTAVHDRKQSESNRDEISDEFVTRVLTRRPLSPAQRRLFKMLRAKGEYWLPSSVIMQNMGLNGNAFGGLFGAIGRRVSTTDGYKEGFTLFEWQWDENREEQDCRLHPVALEAIKRIDP
jgi:hypothetical protein